MDDYSTMNSLDNFDDVYLQEEVLPAVATQVRFAVQIKYDLQIWFTPTSDIETKKLISRHYIRKKFNLGITLDCNFA